MHSAQTRAQTRGEETTLEYDVTHKCVYISTHC